MLQGKMFEKKIILRNIFRANNIQDDISQNFLMTQK